MNQQVTPVKTEHFGFLLVDQYSMSGFSSAIEPLRLANRCSGENLYRWSIYTLDGEPTLASNGLTVIPDGSQDDIGNLSCLFVCGGTNIDKAWSKNLQQLLKKLSKRPGLSLGAICTGSYLLARAGVLDGYHATIHWENMASLREEFPNVHVSDTIYSIDRDRITCAGGSA